MDFAETILCCVQMCGTQEINASHIESILLSQVRVTKIGQEIDVWVLGRTRVRLRIGQPFNQHQTTQR